MKIRQETTNWINKSFLSIILKYAFIHYSGLIILFGFLPVYVPEKIRAEIFTKQLAKTSLELDNNISFVGQPLIKTVIGSNIKIGAGCVFISKFSVNDAGINHPCIISAVRPNATIDIGKNCGFSGTTIVAYNFIKIGDNVNIGVNACIYDTDFHPIDAEARRTNSQDSIMTKPVIIEDDAWIGANVIVLKGVTIGHRSIIGAGSVVTTNVPADSIFAGNPARLIRKI